ncbi:hypothetical protein HBJ58_18615 [Halomonas desiderata]|uniref:hypothetical protein n=1 Tax=Billgrantia desiderata TaxID=52021 RepID=UPI00174AD9FF|nr:hypothetical protein [Halomonas desiderata]
MKGPKRLQGGFSWESSRESRRPRFWLELRGGRNSGELFFVNDANESLLAVKVAPAGFMTADDDTQSLEAADYTYHDVAPNEAVKVAEFDGYYDLDFVFQLSIEVTSPRYGEVLMTTPPKKGCIRGQVLLWDDDEPGKNVVVVER